MKYQLFKYFCVLEHTFSINTVRLPLLIFVFGSICLTTFGQATSTIQQVREDLFYSEFDLKKCFEFDKSITALNDNSPLIKAYKAASEALIAKYSWNPVTKFNYLNHAQQLLEEAVSKDALNVEIRFLRLYIEKSIPAYLGMSKNIKVDKQVIIDNIELLPQINIGADISSYIINYITSPEISTAEEIELIKRKIAIN